MAAKPNRRELQITETMDVQGPEGGLSAMISQAGGDKSMIKDVQKVEAMPGGMELLYTMAAEELMKKAGASKSDAKKIRLYKYGGAVERAYAKGGPARAAAEKTRAAGRGDDSMMLHVSPEEYEVIESMWGPAEINPETGIGEYGFLSKIWKKIKKTVKKIVSSKIFQIVAPIALSIFVPGLGAAIGGMFTGSSAAASVIGNALVQGGLSAAGGGDFMKGALSGAITGGLGSMAGAQVSKIAPGMSARTAEIVGSSLAGGAASSLTGGEFMEGAIMGGLGEYMQPTIEGLVGKGQEMLGLQDPAAGGIMAEGIPDPVAVTGALEGPPGFGDVGGPSGPPAPIPGYGEPGGPSGPPGPAVAPPTPAAGGVAPAPAGALGQFGDMVMPALMGAGILGGASAYEEAVPPEMPEWMMESLPVYSMNRQFRGMDPNAYYTYGQTGAPQSGQHLFMQPEPFAGETGTPTVGPAGGLGGAGGVAGMIAAGQPIPAQLAQSVQGQLQAAGYSPDPNTGNWLPPQPQQLGQGMPGNAMGGYQRGGEFDYWAQNADVPLAAPTVSAAGRYVKGPGTGRSDDIPARLSDGEYVMDAETVSLLGDGSGDAGAKRLDEMRRNLRKHKAKNLSEGGFSHKAKAPHQYMAQGGMARLRRAMTESGRVVNG